ncbi:MAG: aryl-sulfate sulfotransferase [Flavobacteriales bacterium]|nr:aryl-sulfate sulfotransferase [Flavobacteriales bacterium]
MKSLLISIFSTLYIGITIAQTVGIQLNTTEAYDGYTLFAPMGYETTYLIDNCGQVVNSWDSDHRPGLSAYLLEDGSLLRTKNLGNATFNSGGSAGGVEHFDWNGNLTWEYEVSSSTECQHHDVEYLPNGNILMVVWELKTEAEAIQAGRDPDEVENAFWSEKIIEIEPSGSNGGTVVWEWHVWDHIVQDFDPTKDNYGVVADNPQLIDINYPNNNNPTINSDWLHINSVDYNPELDQIVLSSHNTHELWVIDHSTTTSEAAGHTGGTYSSGGDLLYRWGNPQAYDAGTQQDKKFFSQHDARWITEGTDAGKLMVFNNGKNRTPGVSYSSVDIIDPPVDGNGNYTQPAGGQPYLPTDQSWTYTADPTSDFYSSNISGAHRLPNDNTVICEGANGRLFEVKTDGEIVWEYQTPVGTNGPVEQGTNLTNGNSIFRCMRYGANYTGLAGQDLTPGDVIELNSTETCELFENPTRITDRFEITGPQIIQNHATGFITLTELQQGTLLVIYDSCGRLILQKTTSSEIASVNTTFWPAGVYYITISANDSLINRKLVKM